MVGRSCSVCGHEARHEVDNCLVRREPYRDIARRYGISKDALSRHVKAHLPEKLAKAERSEEAAEADKLLWDLRNLQHKTLRCLLDAEKDGDPATLLRAVREARSNVELMLKARGVLNEGTTVNINLVHSEEWLALRGRILWALEPHPEARESVVRALEGDA